MGTLLVPRASVNSLSRTFNGNIVAKYVCNREGQIHGNIMGVTTIENIYTFINSEEDSIVLPETGGGGTYNFYRMGAGMILLGMVLLVAYRTHRKGQYSRGG